MKNIAVLKYYSKKENLLFIFHLINKTKLTSSPKNLSVNNKCQINIESYNFCYLFKTRSALYHHPPTHARIHIIKLIIITGHTNKQKYDAVHFDSTMCCRMTRECTLVFACVCVCGWMNKFSFEMQNVVWKSMSNNTTRKLFPDVYDIILIYSVVIVSTVVWSGSISL